MPLFPAQLNQHPMLMVGVEDETPEIVHAVVLAVGHARELVRIGRMVDTIIGHPLLECIDFIGMTGGQDDHPIHACGFVDIDFHRKRYFTKPVFV